MAADNRGMNERRYEVCAALAETERKREAWAAALDTG
jgi:hypothetical protein